MKEKCVTFCFIKLNTNWFLKYHWGERNERVDSRIAKHLRLRTLGNQAILMLFT